MQAEQAVNSDYILNGLETLSSCFVYKYTHSLTVQWTRNFNTALQGFALFLVQYWKFLVHCTVSLPFDISASIWFWLTLAWNLHGRSFILAWFLSSQELIRNMHVRLFLFVFSLARYLEKHQALIRKFVGVMITVWEQIRQIVEKLDEK